MRGNNNRVAIGGVLVAVGLLLLLQNVGVLGAGWLALWATLFAAGGAAFLVIWYNNRSVWWPLIPGFALVGIGGLMGLEAVDPGAAAVFGGSLFLLCLGVPFWLVYISDRRNWWAVIPGGVLVTLAVVAGLADTGRGPESGGVFFMGLGITFALVYLLPAPNFKTTWAIWPAIGLFALGLVTFAATSTVANYLWPLVLILGGGYVVYRSLHARQAQPPQ